MTPAEHDSPDGARTAPAGRTGPLPEAAGQDPQGALLPQGAAGDAPVNLDRARGPRGATRPQGGPR